MKKENWLSMNLKMTRECFQASPGYFGVKFAIMLYRWGIFIFETEFYRYIIDLIVYGGGSFHDAVFCFCIYSGLGMLTACINLWYERVFTSRHSMRVNRYHNRRLYRASANQKLEQLHSASYADALYDAVYQSGEYFYAFIDRIISTIGSLIMLTYCFHVFLELHPIFLLLVCFKTAVNLFFAGWNNRLDYHAYQCSMPYSRGFQHIRNVFYLKQYARERLIYPIGGLFTDKYRQDYSRNWDEIKKDRFKTNRNDSIRDILSELINVTNLLILVNGLVNGLVTVGSLNLVLSNFSAAADHLEDVLMFFPCARNDARYMKNILTVIESEEFSYPKVDEGTRAHAEFRDVSFSYDGEREVLKHLTIDLPLDKKIAIVGENGSGKSTFLKLLLGLYAPTGGSIAYTGGDPSVTDTSQLFGAMLQDFHTFVLTLSENITLKDRLTEEEVARRDEAVRFSGLDEKISELAQGIDTPLTDEFTDLGTELSGGEMQKLAIARAYMMDRPVLILDEPSSNLDPFSENRLIERINRLTEKKGVILVTHNMAYTKNVDLVIAFCDGQIVEYGSPDQLLQQGSYFADMAAKQAS